MNTISGSACGDHFHREIRVTVHPFVRSDGEDRTKHTTTLAAALEEMREDVRISAARGEAKLYCPERGWLR